MSMDSSDLVKAGCLFFLLTLLGAPPGVVARSTGDTGVVEKLETKVGLLRSQLKQQKNKNKQLKRLVSEQETRIAELEAGELERPVHPTVKRLRRTLEELRQSLEDLRAENSRLAEKVRAANKKQATDKKETETLTELQEENQELRKNNEQLQEQINELQSELQRYKKLSREREAELEEMETRFADMQAVETEREGEKMTITLDEAVLFDPGEAELKESAHTTLNHFIKIADTYPEYRVLVEGHTDNVPLKSDRNFESNWALSAMRAVNVVQFIEANSEIDPTRLAATGYGPYQPVAPNDSPANRKLNRRVEISLVPLEILEAEKSDTAPVGN